MRVILSVFFSYTVDHKEAISQTLRVLKQHWDINKKNNLGWTPLTKISLTNISESDCDLVAEMLRTCDVTAEGPSFSTVEAALIGCKGSPLPSHAGIPIMLIEAGCPLYTTSTGQWPGWNSMHWAAACGNVAVADALLRKDPELLNIATDSDFSEYPLHIAATANNGLEMVQFLHEKRADPRKESKQYELTPLGSYIGDAQIESNSQVLDYLLKASESNGYIAQKSKTERWTALHLAALRAARLDLEGIPGHQQLRQLLQYDVMKSVVNVPMRNGFTPVLLASQYVDYTSVRLLTEAGADISLKSQRGSSCLSMALEGARQPQAGFLDADLKDKCRKTAYQTALYLSGQLRGKPGDMGLTHLHIAAYVGNVEEAERLVQRFIQQM